MNLQTVFENWPEPHTPPFANIKQIGCCIEDENNFDWYRKHTWRELKTLLLSEEIRLDHILDTVEFGSLEKRVHRYFMKGVLSSLAQKANESDSFEGIDDYDWQWVCGIEYDLRHLDSSKKHTSCYSKKEIKDIIALLEFIQKKFSIDPENPFYQSDKEIKAALENWKAYLFLI